MNEFNLKENFAIGSTSWIGVGGMCDLFFKPKSFEELVAFLHINEHNLTVLGNTSNLIIGDAGIRGVVIRLIGSFMNIIKVDDEKVEVGAGMLDKTFSSLMANEEISGFEFLSTIPGNIGGGIKMNCGCFGREIAENIITIKGVDFKGKYIEFKPSELNFSYRRSGLSSSFIITSVVLRGVRSKRQKILDLMSQNQEKRNQSQPTGGKTAGSTFKNPEKYKAWELLERAGLRGVKIGGASFSQKHLNFLINDGSATARDLILLGETARKLVFEKCGVNLEWEILHIGSF